MPEHRSSFDRNLLAAAPNSDRAKLMGVRIDADIALRLARTVWRVIGDHDPVLKAKLAEALDEEIASLSFQAELDAGTDATTPDAVVQILRELRG